MTQSKPRCFSQSSVVYRAGKIVFSRLRFVVVFRSHIFFYYKNIFTRSETGRVSFLLPLRDEWMFDFKMLLVCNSPVSSKRSRINHGVICRD